MNYPIHKCELGDSLYPVSFLNLKGMPKCIYYKGDITILNKQKSIAIIGSRECTDTALSFSREAGRIAADAGVCVINGLALGCDTAAIVGALDNGGKCVAIMPGGLNKVHPKSNEQLAERILENGGCLISEYEPDAEPKKYTYVQRDRLQSALSQGIIVVEATIESGTMHTVEAAIKQEKKMAAYLSAISSWSGNKYAIDKGASAISNMDDLKKYIASLPKVEYSMQMSLADLGIM